MSEQLKISLLRLTTQLSEIKGISTHKKETQVPMSPTLLHSLNLPEHIKNEYLRKRQELLELKTNDPPKEFLSELSLREYQRKAILFLSSIKNKANFSEQRLGKTVETLVTMKVLKENNAIIIAPKSTLIAWQKEYTKWHTGDAIIVGSPTPKEKREKIYKEFQGTLIVNYDTVKNDLDALLKRKIETVVLDEGHRIRKHRVMNKNKGPQFTKAIMSLSRKAKTRYILTGTPSPKNLEQTYGLLSFLFPTLFKSYWGFIEYYFYTDQKQVSRHQSIKVIKEIIPSREKELQEFVELISIQDKRADLLHWLTEPIQKEIIIPLEKQEQKWYNELHETYEIYSQEVETLGDLDRLTRERQLCLDPRLIGIDYEGTKTKWVVDFIKNNPNKHVIIISQFTEYLKLLKGIYFKNALIMSGGTTAKNRNIIQESFNKGENKILLANLEVFKEGITVPKADVMITTDLSFVEGDNQQLYDRIIPTTPELAKDREQEIINLYVDTPTEELLKKAREHEWSLSEIINNYKAVGRS